MIVIPLKLLIKMMAATEEACTYDLDLPWPLHKALLGLAEDGRTLQRPALWSVPVGFVDDAGAGIEGLGGVIRDLYREGAFVRDAARSRRLIASPAARTAARRQYLKLEPEAAACVYRAARLWATEALTVSKNLDTDLWSSPPTYWVNPSKPRHAPAVR